jgi:hypothetical protein
MFSQVSNSLKKSVVVVVMVAMLTFSVPKESEAILLLLFAPLTIGATVALIVTELIIYCATGLICGGGGGGGTTGGDPGSAFVGDSCSASNYCGQTGAGTVQSDGFCTALPPPNSACTNGSFPDDALTINPGLVRIGDDVVVSYDVGVFNYPPNCTLSGPAPIGVMPLTTQTGSSTVTASAAHFFRLECGTTNAEAKLDLVGVIQEI